MSLILEIALVFAVMVVLIGAGGMIGAAKFPAPRSVGTTVGAIGGAVAAIIVLATWEDQVPDLSQYGQACAATDFAGTWRAGQDEHWVFADGGGISCDGHCTYGYLGAPQAWEMGTEDGLVFRFSKGALTAVESGLRCLIDADGQGMRLASNYPGFINVILVRTRK